MTRILIGLAAIGALASLVILLVILDAKLRPVEIEEVPGPCTCPDCTPPFDWDAAERQLKEES